MRRTLPILAAALFVVTAMAEAKPAARQTARPSQTAAKAPAAQKITSVEGITEYRLANGLRVLLFPDDTKPTLTVNVTYDVGSRHESYGETGMAHLLEHMMFKGTPTNGNIPQMLKERGARYNASTWYDRTNYFEVLPASQENLDFALALEADRMVNSNIAKKDLDSEMTVVRNEFESGENDPENVMEERTLSTAFLWHNYGHSTIGSRADIERVPIQRLQAFYRKYYQPDNATLLIAGKFDEARALASVEKTFGRIPRPARTLEEPYTAEPTQDGEREAILRRTGDVQALCAVYHVPAGSHPDFAPLDLLTYVLADTPSGRLYKALVETKKATSVDGFLPGLHDPGFVLFSASVRLEQSLEDARATMMKTLDDIAQNPPTKEEVDRARTAELKDIDLTLNSADRIGMVMSEYIAQGDWRLFFLTRDRIKAVTTDDVLRVAKEYLKPSNRTVGEFIPVASPQRAEVPPRPDVEAMVKNYKGEAPIAAGEAFDSSPANIESRTSRNQAGGVKLALLPKKTRGETVVASMTFHFGTEQSLANRSAAAEAAGDLLMRGTSKHTRQQIQDELDRLKARAMVSGGVTQAVASVETTRENLPAVLNLIAEILREPSFPPTEFDQWKQEQLAGIEEQKSDPQAVGGLAFSRHLNPYPKGDPRYIPTFDEQKADTTALTLDQVRKFYTDFYGASNAEISVVGDFDAKAIETQLSELFGKWKSPAQFVRVPSLYNDVPVVNQSFETPDKANAVFFAGLNLSLRDDDPDYPALIVANNILGGGSLYSRLGTRIRQKEGLSYGVSSLIRASSLDKAGRFTTYAIYAPQNAQKLETAFREEVARAVREGFTPEEVAEAKKGILQGRKISRAQDNALAQTLSSYLFIGRTLAWDADLEARIAALSPDQVNSALKRWLDPSKITIIKAGDFAKAR